MIKSWMIGLLFLLLPFIVIAQSQNRHDSLLQQQAIKMTKRLQDSLAINSAAYNKLLEINYQLLKRKTTLMRETGARAAVSKRIQQMENTRDSLYGRVLSTVQFERYMSLKPFLLVTQ